MIFMSNNYSVSKSRLHSAKKGVGRYLIRIFFLLSYIQFGSIKQTEIKNRNRATSLLLL